jgi:hypothetical protein
MKYNIIKSTIFYDVMPYILVKVYRPIGRKVLFFLQFGRVSQLAAWFLLGLLFYPEDEGSMIFRNVDKEKQKGRQRKSQC